MLEGLYGLAPMQGQRGLFLGDLGGGLGILPAFLIGGAAAGTAISSWLQSDDWDRGVYNNVVLELDDTFKAWDRIGWDNGCWNKYPKKRAEFKALWIRFGKHHGEYGLIGGWGDRTKLYTGYVPDGAELPIRNNILPQLKRIGEFLNRNCGAKLNVGAPSTERETRTTGTIFTPTPGKEDSPAPARTAGSQDWGKIVQWGAIGLGVVLVASVARGFTSR